MSLNTLIKNVQMKGYKIHHYESDFQFSLILQDRDGTHIDAWLETSIPRRVLIKEEISNKLEQILNN